MSIDAFLGSTLHVDLQTGKPPMVHTDASGNAPVWAAAHRDELRAALAEHGSVLVRGLGLGEVAAVGAVFGRLADGLMSEKEAFDPRSVHTGGVLGASNWAANQVMCSHHELSYLCEVPSLMMFACVAGPAAGGATGVVDATTMLDALPAELTMRFEREGWMLVRNYNDEMGASVAESFGTDDRGAVEAYCRANAIELEWRPDGALHTRQRRSAVIRHPVTGRRCWFNQIAFLNEWTLEPEVREYLVEIYGAEGLPFNTRYGNGEPIDEDVIQTINAVYEAHIAREPLQAGDLLLVDNIRTAHSREPYEGERKVLVALADPVHIADCSPTVPIGCTN